MKRQRDFRAEYAKRRARGIALGRSGPQARGHARHGEAPAKARGQTGFNAHLEAGLRELRRTGNLSRAAKEIGASTERLRRYARENAKAEWRGRNWHFEDTRLREVAIVSQGQRQTLIVRGFQPASTAGEYDNARRQFLSTNDPELLAPFVGVEVSDAKGTPHLLETDPNGIYEADAAGEPAFHEIYRIIQ